MSCSTCPLAKANAATYAPAQYTATAAYAAPVYSSGLGFGSYSAPRVLAPQTVSVTASSGQCGKPSTPCAPLPPVTVTCAYPPCEPLVNCIVEASGQYDMDSDDDDLCDADTDCCSSCPSDGSLCGSCGSCSSITSTGTSATTTTSTIIVSSGGSCCPKKSANRCPAPSDLPRCFQKYLNKCNVVSYYYVSLQGNGAFTSIRGAVAQALRDPTAGPVVINIDVGLYSLDNSLNNSREITFLGTSVNGNPATHIVGTATSGGNKSWSGVHFTGRRTIYSMKGSEDSLCLLTDSMQSVHVGENAQIRNACNNIFFENSTFNYLNLKKGARVLQSPGSGNITIRNSYFNLRRCSTACSATSFHCHAGSACDSAIRSLWQDNIWNVEIESGSNFHLHQVAGNSHIHLQSDVVNMLKASPIVAVLGNDVAQHNLQVSVHSIHMQSSAECNLGNSTLLRNLFSSPSSFNHIAVQAATIENARAALYDAPVTSGVLVTSYITFSATRVSAPTGVVAWQFLLGPTTTLNLNLRGVNHNTHNSNVSPVLLTESSAGAVANIWLASHTTFNYEFAGTLATSPPWVTTTLTSTFAGVDNVTGYFIRDAGLPSLPAGFGPIVN